MTHFKNNDLTIFLFWLILGRLKSLVVEGTHQMKASGFLHYVERALERAHHLSKYEGQKQRYYHNINTAAKIKGQLKWQDVILWFRHHRPHAQVHHPADDRSGRGHGRPGSLRRCSPYRRKALGSGHRVNGLQRHSWTKRNCLLQIFWSLVLGWCS